MVKLILESEDFLDVCNTVGQEPLRQRTKISSMILGIKHAYPIALYSLVRYNA